MLRMFRQFSIPVLSVVMLAACASSGHKIADADVASLQKGKTTYAEAVGKLGRPTSTSADSSGKKTLTYVYSHSQVDAKSFIPFAGAFVGGTNTDTQSLSLVFDKNELLEEYSTSQGSYETRNH